MTRINLNAGLPGGPVVQAAGFWNDAGGQSHALFWNGDGLINVGNLGCSLRTTTPPDRDPILGLNQNGEITGQSLRPDVYGDRVFFWREGMGEGMGEGMPVEIGTLADSETELHRDGLPDRRNFINNLGHVVGRSLLAEKPKHRFGKARLHGFIWDEDNGIRDLNDLTSGVRVEWATAINDRGYILAGPGALLIYPADDPPTSAAASQAGPASAATVDAALLAWVAPDASDDDDADLLAQSLVDDLAMMLVESQRLPSPARTQTPPAGMRGRHPDQVSVLASSIPVGCYAGAWADGHNSRPRVSSSHTYYETRQKKDRNTALPLMGGRMVPETRPAANSSDAPYSQRISTHRSEPVGTATDGRVSPA
ncbi:MAG: hypothetical protein ACYTG0_20320 [Planctomycetota bacterium]